MMFGGLFEVTDLIMHSPQIIDQNNIPERENYHRNIIFVPKKKMTQLQRNQFSNHKK